MVDIVMLLTIRAVRWVPPSPGVGWLPVSFVGAGSCAGMTWSTVQCRRRRGLLADPDRYPRAAGSRL